jgi:hypothetical protein
VAIDAYIAAMMCPMHTHLDSLLGALNMFALVFALLPAISWSLVVCTTDADAKNCCPIREFKTARYDDLPFVEGSSNPIPPHYYGLSYTTFQVDQYDGFLPATSGNQTIIAFGGSGNISIPDSYNSRLYYFTRAADAL